MEDEARAAGGIMDTPAWGYGQDSRSSCHRSSCLAELLRGAECFGIISLHVP